jgi:lysyl-tRNA synthetase class 2
VSEEELRDARVRKAEEHRARGDEPWKVRFERTDTAAGLHEEHESLPPGEGSGTKARIAGRLMTSRVQGKLAFGDLVDGSGKIQLFVAGDALAPFLELDTGDIVGAVGEVVRTKRGELSVRPDEVVLLAKSLRPLPDKWHGLRDVEARFRHRYVDLIANPRAREIAGIRVRAVRAFREFLDARNFVEVETPVLHPIPGGATARPFVTHHNALDTDLYLRIATELYLKRLVVGGMERVYEIGRVFRNEGLGYRWNPEFTLLEAYQAYADYHDMMDLTEQMLRFVALEAVGAAELTWEERTISLAGPWRRVSVLEAASEAVGEDVSFDRSLDDLRAMVANAGVEVKPWWGKGLLIEQLRDEVVEKSIVQPTILYDYPIEVSPLARTHRDNPELTERFEVICAGRELANAFSELNDPIEQRRRFEQQQSMRDHGDMEASPVDDPFVTALEYGLPPTGGLGVGIDRFVMLLADVHSIREVILFPTLRPESAAPGEPGGRQES